MISFALTALVFLVGTLVPAYFALYLISYLGERHLRFIAALAIGLTFWFFFDTFGDASYLYVNNAIYPFIDFGGWPHFAAIAAFVGGITALAVFDYIAVPSNDAYSITASSSTTNSNKKRPLGILFLIPVAVAAVMGIHGLGEGFDFGAAAAQTTATLATAFGGSGPGQYNPLISYPLHKFFEASIIAAVYAAYVRSSGLNVKRGWHIPVLGLLFGLTSVIGSIFGYYLLAYTSVSIDTTYFYAFGVTAAFYAALRLVQPLNPKFKIGENVPLYLGGKVFLALTIGFFLLYISALFH